jgi:hypothetical protein
VSLIINHQSSAPEGEKGFSFFFGGFGFWISNPSHLPHQYNTQIIEGNHFLT